MKIQNAIAERVNSQAKDFFHNGISMSLIALADNSKVLMTNQLNEYKMPVSEKWVGREFNELVFYLPSYWDADDNCPNLHWTKECLAQFVNHCLSKKTWFGPGHTIANGNPAQDLSPTMKMQNLIFTDPIELDVTLAPLDIFDKRIHFLTIIPIFGDELDYKTTKGTLKFLQKLTLKDATEKLDDYRFTFLRSRWKMY